MINVDALTARVIHVDSRLRKSGRAEDCTVELNEPIHLPKGAVCWCSAVALPFSWTNVCSLNNILHITERTLVGTTAQSERFEVPLASDEYSRSQLGTVIAAAL